MGKHLLVALFRVLRLVDTYNFDLRELVQTVQAAHVLTIRTSLTTETLGVGTVFDGQVLLVENHVAIDICDRHLGRRNQVEVVYFAVIHLAFLVRQLTGTVTRSGVHHSWRHNLRIAGLVGFSEEEVDECTL